MSRGMNIVVGTASGKPGRMKHRDKHINWGDISVEVQQTGVNVRRPWAVAPRIDPASLRDPTTVLCNVSECNYG